MWNPGKRRVAIAAGVCLTAAAGCSHPEAPPDPPVSTTIAFVAGANQSAPAGTIIPTAPAVEVRDQYGDVFPGVPVIFTIANGDGTVPNTPVVTDAAGRAASPPWTLGKSATTQTLRASATAAVTATIDAAIASSYTVDVRFFGPTMPAVTAAMFTFAAARIRAVVTGDLPSIAPFAPAENLADACGTPGLPTAFSEPIDDVLIFASVGPIDGAGKVLASAGPCGIRGDTGMADRQTFIGTMNFDSDDIESLIGQGNLPDVILHEMLHVVGIGTLWTTYGLLADAGTPQTRYTGVLGVGACIAFPGGSSACPNGVPVEDTGGSGTADGHWRESVFGNELMTGFVTRPTPGFTGILNPLSTMSIHSLADMGYGVNVAAADPYTLPGPPALRGMALAGNNSGWETLKRPRLRISRGGRLTLIPRPPD